MRYRHIRKPGGTELANAEETLPPRYTSYLRVPTFRTGRWIRWRARLSDVLKLQETLFRSGTSYVLDVPNPRSTDGVCILRIGIQGRWR